MIGLRAVSCGECNRILHPGGYCAPCDAGMPRQRKIQVELEIGGRRGYVGMVDARMQDNLNLLVLEWPEPLPPMTARSVDGVVFLDPIFPLVDRR